MSTKSSTTTRAVGRFRRLGAVFAALSIGASVSTVVASDAAHAVPRPAAIGAVAAGASAPAMPGDVTVTLITGDRVVATRGGTLRSATAGPGRQHVDFVITHAANGLNVIPADALKLVAAGRVDPRLFNITTLIRFGYTDDKVASIPTMMRGIRSGGGAAGAAAQFGDATANAMWSAGISMARVPHADAANFWSSASAALTSAAAGDDAHLWLDGIRQLSLDRSVKQIGGPAARAKGLTGAGVRVSVLDSGIDASHPDFAGRIVAARDFSGSDSIDDDVGHGTHVASIIAGSGAASGGKYAGVAPNAQLVIGKVCDGFGCSESAIIAGIYWASVIQEAKVVNLSLGGKDAPELDLMESSINAVTRRLGTLFVIAAGNDGCPSAGGTVGSPGSAAAALTVGAVDRAGAMAGFSSCGPVTGGSLIKPEITAPGADIVAARAANGVFPPVAGAKRYTTLSGTSMATPHVAGAAALLAQQHPTWTGPQIKAQLVGSARRTNDSPAYRQGAGQVDLARAIVGDWTVAQANFDLGMQRWPHADDSVVRRSMTLRNNGNAAVTLQLSAHAATGSSPAPTGVFALSAETVSIDPGQQATVDLIADTRIASPDGTYTGEVSITDGTVSRVVLFSVDKEGESYDVVFDHIGLDGKRTNDAGTIASDVTTGRSRFVLPLSSVSPGVVRTRLPRGHYVMTTLFVTDDTFAMLSTADFSVSASTPRMVLDARTTKPLLVRAPAAQQAPLLRAVEISRWKLPFGNAGGGIASSNPGRILRSGRITASSRTLVADSAMIASAYTAAVDAGGRLTPGSPLHILTRTWPVHQPQLIDLRFTDAQLADVRLVVPKLAAPLFASAALIPVVRGSVLSFAVLTPPDAASAVHVKVPSSPDMYWIPAMAVDTDSEVVDTDDLAQYVQIWTTASYAAGQIHRVNLAQRAPYSPTLGSTTDGASTALTPDSIPGTRGNYQPPFMRRHPTDSTTDEMLVELQALGMSSAATAVFLSNAEDSVQLVLRRNGKVLIEESSDSTFGGIARIPTGGGAYQLDLRVQSPTAMAGQLGLPSATRIQWKFEIAPTASPRWQPLPMSVVRFGAMTRTAATATFPVRVVRQATPSPKPDAVSALTVEVSANGGASWVKAELAPDGAGRFIATIPSALAKSALAVRTTAKSADGATVSQTSAGVFRP